MAGTLRGPWMARGAGLAERRDLPADGHPQHWAPSTATRRQSCRKITPPAFGREVPPTTHRHVRRLHRTMRCPRGACRATVGTHVAAVGGWGSPRPKARGKHRTSAHRVPPQQSPRLWGNVGVPPGRRLGEYRTFAHRVPPQQSPRLWGNVGVPPAEGWGRVTDGARPGCGTGRGGRRRRPPRRSRGGRGERPGPAAG